MRLLHNALVNIVDEYMGLQWALSLPTVMNELGPQLTSQNGFSSLDFSSRSWS